MLSVKIPELTLPTTFPLLVPMIGGTVANPTTPTLTQLLSTGLGTILPTFCVDPQGVYGYAGNASTSGGTNGIYKITLATGAIALLIPAATLFLSGVQATLSGGMCTSADGSTLYFGISHFYNGASGFKAYNQTIASVPTAGGAMTIIAGNGGDTVAPASTDGTLTSANFLGVSSMAPDGLGNLYVASFNSQPDKIRKVAISTGVVTSIGAADPNGYGGGMAYIAASGNLYCCNSFNGAVVQINTVTGGVTPIYSSGTSNPAILVGVDAAEAYLYFTILSIGTGKSVNRVNIATKALQAILTTLPAALSTFNNTQFFNNGLIFADVASNIQTVPG